MALSRAARPAAGGSARLPDSALFSRESASARSWRATPSLRAPAYPSASARMCPTTLATGGARARPGAAAVARPGAGAGARPGAGASASAGAHPRAGAHPCACAGAGAGAGARCHPTLTAVTRNHQSRDQHGHHPAHNRPAVPPEPDPSPRRPAVAAHAFSLHRSCPRSKTAGHLDSMTGRCTRARRRPTLPHDLPCSTIGAGGLNCRVRNGNGCCPSAIATGNASSGPWVALTTDYEGSPNPRRAGFVESAPLNPSTWVPNNCIARCSVHERPCNECPVKPHGRLVPVG